MSDGQRAVTITEVAARAGVSISTASKALNRRGQLRNETRERVFAAADELGYQPNALARSLVQRRSYTVGLLSTESADRFNIPLHLGLENALGAGRVSVFLCDGRADPERERFYLESLLSRRVDGIVVTGVRTDARPPLADVPLPVPVVYAYSRSADPGDLSVLPDDEQGGRLAAEHLLAAGRRTFAHVTGPTEYAAVRDRLTGFRAALAEAGVALPDARVRCGPWREEFGRAATAELLAARPEVDAVFCGNDLLARGALDTLRESGRRVPEDVGVVGFDNWGVLAEGARPPLTSVDMDLQGLGELAARRLLSLIEGNRESGLVHHPCRLEVRASGGGPAVR
ncbi:transcriptional regulator, LacI family [Streptomyces zhaozhouensis]|uniref:Transcriptional regulator, LacI family n=1 Tax=Streptomyces zhaozhouensis TaxID=1300267 RepID=A0A286E6X1_9ACTN|nr:LacI family DNA-binding transcriptional regulator [Streptomyces zhaozhouensis]SOD66652.1 transcriptional regulator, LacI family [Streptomyces zhaozhouensis]